MDILGLVKEQLHSGAIDKISGILGEDSAKTTSALGGAVPAILGGLINKVSNEGGANEIMDLITKGGHDGGIMSKFSGLLGGGDDTTNLLSSGSGILSSIFGDKLSGIVSTISKLGGISEGSGSSLLSMAAPLILGAIGGQTKGSGVSGLTSLLNSQKDSLSAAMPSGFGNLLSMAGLGSLLGGVGNVASGAANVVGNVASGTANVIGDVASGAANVVGNVATGAANVVGNVASGAANVVGGAANLAGDAVKGTANVVGDVVGGAANAGKKIVGGAADLAGDVVGGAANAGKKIVGGAADLAGDVADTATSGFKKILPWLLAAALAFGALVLWKTCQKPAENAIEGAATMVDSTANNMADAVKKTLSTGVELSFGSKSIENEMINFIESKDSVVNKTTWFNFRNLKFNTASAEIDSTSMQEVQNIVEILKAFPNVKAKIGGYTDNVGDAKANLKLSDARAKNVCAALEARGIDKSRLSAEGYGQEFPVASNETEEGKAQNRRIAVRITEK